MKYLQSKIILPVVLLIVLLLVLAGVWYFSNRNYTYYIVTYGEVDLSMGNAVIIENVPAGKIDGIIPGNKAAEEIIFRLIISDQYSIPSASSIQIVSSTEHSQAHVMIDIQASRDYFLPGDTIFTSGYSKRSRASNRESGMNGHDSLVFRIQLMASDKRMPVDSPKFKGLKKIQELIVDGTYKYYVGNLESLEKAKKLKSMVIKKGIHDAFIVPFVDDERISIQQALSYEK